MPRTRRCNGIEVMDSNINIVGGQSFSQDKEFLTHEIFVAKLKMVIAVVLVVVAVVAFIVSMDNKVDLQDGRSYMVTYASDMSTLASIGGRSVAEAFYQDYGECLIGEARILDGIGTQIVYCYNIILSVIIIFGVYLFLISMNKKKTLQKILENTGKILPVGMEINNGNAANLGANDFGHLPEL